MTTARCVWEEEPGLEEVSEAAVEETPAAINEIHQDLLIAAVEIGGILDMANWASGGIAARVHQTGKRTIDITVGELLGMLKAQDQLLRNTEWEHNQGAGS